MMAVPAWFALSWLQERNMWGTEDVVREGRSLAIVAPDIVMGILFSWCAVAHLYGNTRFPRNPC